jgi:hypothetical protein
MNPLGKSSKSPSIRRILVALAITFAGLGTVALATPESDLNGELAVLYPATVHKPAPIVTSTNTTASASQVEAALQALATTGTGSADSAADLNYAVLTLGSGSGAGNNLLPAALASDTIAMAKDIFGSITAQATPNNSYVAGVAAISSTDFIIGSTLTTTITATQEAIAADAIADVGSGPTSSGSNAAQILASILTSESTTPGETAAQEGLVAGDAIAKVAGASSAPYTTIGAAIAASGALTTSTETGDYLAALFNKENATFNVQGFSQGFASNGLTALTASSGVETVAADLTGDSTATADAIKKNVFIGLVDAGLAVSTSTASVLEAVTTGLLGPNYDTSLSMTSSALEDANRASFTNYLVTLYPAFPAALASAAANQLSDPTDDVAKFANTVAGATTVKLTGSNGISTEAQDVGNDFALSNITSNSSANFKIKVGVTQGVVKDYATDANPIVQAVAEQVISTSGTTLAAQEQFADNFMTALATTTTYSDGNGYEISISDAERGQMAAGLAVLYSTYSSGVYAAAVPGIASAAAAQSGGGVPTATTYATVTLPVAVALATGTYPGESTTDFAAAVSGVAISGTAIGAPDELAAYLIAAANSAKDFSLIGPIAVADAESSSVLAYSAYSGNVDLFLQALSHESKDSNATLLEDIAVALATTGGSPVTPGEAARDLSIGGGSSAALKIAGAVIGALSPTDTSDIILVSGSVATTLNISNDKSLAKDLGIQVTGTAINNPTIVPAIAQAIAAALTGTDPTLGADEGTIAVAAATELTGTGSVFIPQVAEHVATANGTGTGLLSSQATEAAAIIKAFSTYAVTTATGVEAISLAEGDNPLTSATAYATDIAPLNGGPNAVTPIATLAATGQTPLTSGSIGVAVDEVAKVASTTGLSGSVAAAVAVAAAGSSPSESTLNNSIFDVAEVFAASSTSAGPLKYVADEGIAQSLTGALNLSGSDQAAAAVAVLFAEQLTSQAYSGGNATILETLVKDVAVAAPGFGADIMGYVADTIASATGSGWTTTVGHTEGTDEKVEAAIEADIEAVVPVGEDTYIVTADTDGQAMTSNPDFVNDDTTTVIADETPVIDF